MILSLQFCKIRWFLNLRKTEKITKSFPDLNNHWIVAFCLLIEN